ncbi:hypothetical protein THIOM_002887 [Candidatus Thiomargarita nelsonii]|uniref:Uncharacterized protein n=1 Tax=Candidatus Thiomargarita nelsonii TaxID=1003181 RepID=A0A176S073_9GAMM|nr:hypothetical protein THIOM_002887 [Candidatus Thiomargarita nelsonii]
MIFIFSPKSVKRRATTRDCPYRVHDCYVGAISCACLCRLSQRAIAFRWYKKNRLRLKHRVCHKNQTTGISKRRVNAINLITTN